MPVVMTKAEDFTYISLFFNLGPVYEPPRRMSIYLRA